MNLFATVIASLLITASGLAGFTIFNDNMASSEPSFSGTFAYPLDGGTGTDSTPSNGDVLVGQTDGTYSPQATSTLGIATGADFGQTFEINASGASAPTTTIPVQFPDKLYASSTILVDNGLTMYGTGSANGITFGADQAVPLYLYHAPGGSITTTNNLNIGNLTAGSISGSNNLVITKTTSPQAWFRYDSSNGVKIFSNSAGLTDYDAIGTNPLHTWSINGTEGLRYDGNLGLGTTSPYAKLSVVGETVASHFTATSTTATSTFSGDISAQKGIYFDADLDSYIDSLSDDEITFFIGGAKSEVFNGTQVVFNEDGADRDFRIEASGEANAFVVNGANGNLGLGVNDPTARIEALGLGATTPDADWFTDATFGISFLDDQTQTASLTAYAGATDTQRPLIFTRRSRGDLGTPTAVQVGDYLGSLISSGHDGTSFEQGASINFIADDTISSGNVPTALDFETGDNFAGRASRLRIDSNGNVGVGTTSPYAKLSVVGEVVASHFTATTTNTNTFSGDIQLTGSSAETITTNDTELLLEQTGDAFGTTRLRLQNRSGANGALFENPSLDLVDFIFKPQTSTQQNIRFEGRSAQQIGGNSDQWEIGPADNEILTLGTVSNNFARGNVGIATTSPYAKLSVVGEVVASHFTATSTTATSTLQDTVIVSTKSYPSFWVTRGTASSGQRFSIEPLSNLNGVAFDNITTNGNYIFLRSGSEKFRFNSSGHLALGSNGFYGPSSALSVNGSASFGGSYKQTAAPTDGVIIEGNTGIGTTSPYAKLGIGSAGNGIGFVPTATSTIDNHLHVKGNLEVDGSTFDWIFDEWEAGTHISIDETLAFTEANGHLPFIDGHDTPRTSLNVATMLGQLWEATERAWIALFEHEERLEAVEEQNKDILKRLDALEAENEELKAQLHIKNNICSIW